MKPIIQEEKTGCGFAVVATIVQLSYMEVKAKANSLGIFAEDERLYSETSYIRRLLNEYGVKTSGDEKPFQSWEVLPNLALLSFKYHIERGRPYWHWAVFRRENGNSVVFDPATYLENNERTDFEDMHPKWYIEVSKK